MDLRKALVVGTVALAMLGAACGDDDGGGGGGGGGNGGASLTAVDFAFEPTSLSVSRGDTIAVTNEGEATHTFTVEEGEEHLIDQELAPGDSADVTVDIEPGEYEFYCEFHPEEMTGTLTVS
jgi:plastocyanin